MMNTLREDSLPWYKQFWPWFLILLPLSVVVASIITFLIAQGNSPSLVQSDYYKEGLAINASKQLEEKALRLGVSAVVSVNSTALTVHLNAPKVQPSHLIVALRHPTLEQYDQTLNLVKIANGIYQAPFKLPKQGKWYIYITPPNNHWKISRTSTLTTP